MMAQIAEMNTNSSALILYFFALIAADFAIINRKILDIEYRNRAPANWQGLIFLLKMRFGSRDRYAVSAGFGIRWMPGRKVRRIKMKRS